MRYYIITMSKSHHEITEEQKKLLMSTNATQFELKDGSIVKLNTISEVLPEDKYFQTFPDKRPEEVRNDFDSKYAQYTGDQIRKPTKRAKELMLEGLAEYCRQNPHAEKTKKMLEEKSLFA
jgi:hypothetical protein